MNLEIGQRVIFRSLHWEVADNASESYVELFGRSHENRGRSVRVILGLEPSSEQTSQPSSGPWASPTGTTPPGRRCTTPTA